MKFKYEVSSVEVPQVQEEKLHVRGLEIYERRVRRELTRQEIVIIPVITRISRERVVTGPLAIVRSSVHTPVFQCPSVPRAIDGTWLQ